MLARQLAAAGQMLTVGTDLLLQRYPAALYRRIAPTGELPPVFCFHSPQPEPFEAVLEFLVRNGYRTLVADEFYALMTGAARDAGGRSVLLTFDDGMGRVWSVIYPLLKKYGLRASCFIIPGRVQERPEGTYYPNLEDVWNGRASFEEVNSRDDSDQPLATWQEISAMHESGVIDFQSHTWDHRLICTSPKVVDFVSPSTLENFHPFEFSMFRDDDVSAGSLDRPALGSPIYTTAPRMSSRLRYRPDPRAAAICVDYVKNHDGSAFFDRPGWQQELFDLVREAAALGDYESEHERKEAIVRDLRRAKSTIEARLPGQRVRHVAFPWGEGSAAAIDAAQHTGHEACFWNKVDGRLVNYAGGDPLQIARIGEDFARSLPGEGRVPLRQVVAGKLKNRFRRGSPYLSH